MPRLPDALRTKLADTVERILAPDLNLRALAREMDNASGAIRTRSWTAPTTVGSETVIQVAEALFAIPGHEPDVTLLTADAGSPVYMQRWWLRRELTSDGYGQDGLYVHRFQNDDPEQFHNHPWPSASLLLGGGPIFEDTRHGTTVINNRSVVLRPASHRHRIRLRHGPVLHGGSVARIPAMTLFATGRRVQQWGFEQPDGSIKPAKKTAPTDQPLPRR